MAPADVTPFRGLDVSGRERQWKEVPLPERRGLVRETLEKAPSDLAEAVAGVLGYGRVTQSFRADIARLAALGAQDDEACNGNDEEPD
jgi:hypothetical protein